MKTLKEALFSKKNMKNSFDIQPYEFFSDLNKYYNETGPFVVILTPKPDKIYKFDRVLFVIETKYNLKKVFNGIKNLEDIDLVESTTIDDLKAIKRHKYFSLLFCKNSTSTKITCYGLNPEQYAKESFAIKSFSFDDYRYIKNPEDEVELEYIYNDFIKPNLNS